MALTNMDNCAVRASHPNVLDTVALLSNTILAQPYGLHESTPDLDEVSRFYDSSSSHASSNSHCAQDTLRGDQSLKSSVNAL